MAHAQYLRGRAVGFATQAVTTNDPITAFRGLAIMCREGAERLERHPKSRTLVSNVAD